MARRQRGSRSYPSVSSAAAEPCPASWLNHCRRGSPQGVPLDKALGRKTSILRHRIQVTPVLRRAIEGEKTLPHSEHHLRREAPGTHADSVQARTSPRAPSGRSCSLYVEHLEAYYLSPETPASLPAAWMESTLPYYQHLYWRGAPGAPVDFSRECLRTKLLATRWAS